MNDQHHFVCHRMQAAQSTNQSGGRGYAFDRMIDESPLWLRALAETFRPRSIIILLALAGVISLWWL
jgi:hypothetical protein